MAFRSTAFMGVLVAISGTAIAFSTPATAATVTVQGTDAIFLSGRTDVTIPPLGSPFPELGRHGYVLSDFLQETFPSLLPASGGQLFSFNADGLVHYFNGSAAPGSPAFGPDGNGLGGSNLLSLGGISGYQGPQGALVGLFLDDAIPTGTAPTALDFTPSGLGSSFTSLAPGLNQVFFIGDGLTGTGTGSLQNFKAPTRATRLFLGIADGFGFNGAPGAYEDNDGAYRVSVKTTTPPESVPEPATLSGLLLLGGLSTLSRKRAVSDRA